MRDGKIAIEANVFVRAIRGVKSGRSPESVAAEFGGGRKIGSNAVETDPVKLFGRRVDNFLAAKCPDGSKGTRLIPDKFAALQDAMREVFAKIPRPDKVVKASATSAEDFNNAEIDDLLSFLS